MTPTEPGRYSARQIIYDLLGRKIPAMTEIVEVVDGAPNERGHKLLVKTGLKQPRYRSLNCYDWLTLPIQGED